MTNPQEQCCEKCNPFPGKSCANKSFFNCPCDCHSHQEGEKCYKCTPEKFKIEPGGVLPICEKHWEESTTKPENQEKEEWRNKSVWDTIMAHHDLMKTALKENQEKRTYGVCVCGGSNVGEVCNDCGGYNYGQPENQESWDDCRLPACKDKSCSNYGSCIEYCMHADPSFIRQLLSNQKSSLVEALREEYGGDFMGDGVRVGKVLHKLGLLKRD